MDFTFLPDYYSYFLNGAWKTLQLSFFSVIAGTLLGVLVALMRLSSNWILKAISATYVEIIRGTPMLVQIFIIYYGLAEFGIVMSAFVSGIFALSLNIAAYMSEVFRAGIDAIDKGQMEAARSLGMTRSMAMRHIILPQAFRNMLPAIGNEFIVIIKDSSLVSVIGIGELMYNADVVRGVTFIPLEPLLVAALIYLIMTFTLSKLLGRLERKLKRSA
ncbi:amino acid ABC transporter permease [Paenibacillus sp. GCM10023252]|uniref:amino acid ABC transporter permease n=1 Tax=Paenibacillus sp. GCM10023252 TaxID=3252649 RepID=UPI00361436B1